MLDEVQNWSLQHRDLKHFVEISLVFLAYVIAGRLGQATTNIRSSNLGPVWPAYGIALAAILICGYRVWPGVLTGAFVVAFFSPVSHLAALGQAIGATTAATTGAFLLHRLANFHSSLSRLTDVLSLIFVGGFCSATISASIGTLVLFSTHVHAYSGLVGAWLIYWLGDATGVLLVTPLVLRATDFVELRDRDRIAELVALISLLVVTCLIIFGDLASIPIKLDVMAFAVLPFVIWAAIRFGLGVTAFTILVIATIATIETALGTGPFATNTNFVNAVLLDIFFGVLSVSGLSLAAVIAERAHAEREREQVVSKQAALETRLEAAHALRLSEERWRLAAQAGKMYAYEWDVTTDAVVRSGEVASVLGPEASILTREQVLARVHPDDRALFIASATERTPDNPDTQISYRMLEPDGSVKWLGKTAHAYFDGNGRMVRMIGMVTDITQCKLGEEKLREYERAVEGAEEFITVFDREYRCLMANRTYLKRRKLTREQVVGHFAYELVDKEIYTTVIQPKMDECFQGKVVKYELRYTYPAIGERDLLAAYYPVEGRNGVDRIVCVLHDITDHKRAERALAEMSRKLIEAQEQERRRIARELHDDINQRLALLSVELETSEQNPPDSSADTSLLLSRIKGQIKEISSDLQSLSHQLHSSHLELLGIVAASKIFCREFSALQNVEIDFNHDEILGSVPYDISICLFRVLQEALHNAAKHSKVRHFDINLSRSESQLHLTVSDRGVGFDPETASDRTGLGLISMRERVRSVNGTISIESRPMGGTTIRVHVPRGLQDAAKREAI